MHLCISPSALWAACIPNSAANACGPLPQDATKRPDRRAEALLVHALHRYVDENRTPGV